MHCTKILLFILTNFLFCGVFASESYLQVVQNPTTQTECLQVAIRTLEIPNTRHRIQLVGVSHIGSRAYYEEVQSLLNKADVVLFEGVDGDRAAFRAAGKEKAPERSTLQANLARSLGLAFQLHVIDYSPEHFMNSDVSSRQLLALFEGRELPEKEEDAKEHLEHLLQTMEQTTVTGQLGAAVLDFLEQRPGWSRGMRWAMVHTLGSVQGDLSTYAGLPESMRVFMEVLIDRRNDVVLSDIREQVATLEEGGTIAVFYGAAHMYDFHERLMQEYGAEEVDVTWKNAFCANLQRSGLNVIQKQAVRWFVFQQMRTLQVMSGQSN